MTLEKAKKTCECCIHYEICKTSHPIIVCMGGVCGFYEDKARFIKLPCKVGDKIWLVHSCCGSKWVENYNVLKVGITVEGIITDVGYDFKDIGKTVFLSRKEAEKALKETTT